MTQKPVYYSPRTEWSFVTNQELLCDSYGSGIDDYEYEEINW